MKRLTFILVLLALLLAPLPVGAQGGSSYTITVVGVGTASARPDLIAFEVGAEAVNSDSVAAYQSVTDQLNAVRVGLIEAKVSPVDIQLLTITVTPQDRTDNGAAPTGEFLFRARGALHVVVRSTRTLEPVLTAAVNAGASAIQNFTFGFKDTTAIEQRARTDAVSNAYKRAEQLAGAMSVAVGDPIIIVEDDVTMSFAENNTVADTGPTVSQFPLEAGEATIRVRVTVTFALRASR
jgi:uncharacterized protein YggE